MLVLAGVAGCGARHTEQAATAAPSEDGALANGPAGASSAQATAGESAGHEALGETPAARSSGATRSGTVNRITLSDRRCVQFDPQWIDVRVGQSVTWHSDLKTPVTIYVTPGIFDKMSFRVRPGATVSTGPARAPGRYSFWTEPTACREAPRGVLLAGPGVRVRETFYASAPGIK